MKGQRAVTNTIPFKPTATRDTCGEYVSFLPYLRVKCDFILISFILKHTIRGYIIFVPLLPLKVSIHEISIHCLPNLYHSLKALFDWKLESEVLPSQTYLRCKQTPHLCQTPPNLKGCVMISGSHMSTCDVRTQGHLQSCLATQRQYPHSHRHTDRSRQEQPGAVGGNRGTDLPPGVVGALTVGC